MILDEKLEHACYTLSIRPYTIDALAAELKVTRPAAERRLEKLLELLKLLRKHGYTNKTVRIDHVRTGTRGPPTATYFISPE